MRSVKMNSELMRVSPEMKELLNSLKSKFNTSGIKASRIIAQMIKESEIKIMTKKEVK
jgi:hypothetical protein